MSILQIRRFTLSRVGTHFSFSEHLGLLQYCILIIYVMKSLLFPCAYLLFVDVSSFPCNKNKKKIIRTQIYSCTQGLCICKIVKRIKMKEVFFSLFLMSIAVGGGLRLI